MQPKAPVLCLKIMSFSSLDSENVDFSNEKSRKAQSHSHEQRRQFSGDRTKGEYRSKALESSGRSTMAEGDGIAVRERHQYGRRNLLVSCGLPDEGGQGAVSNQVQTGASCRHQFKENGRSIRKLSSTEEDAAIPSHSESCESTETAQSSLSGYKKQGDSLKKSRPRSSPAVCPAARLFSRSISDIKADVKQSCCKPARTSSQGLATSTSSRLQCPPRPDTKKDDHMRGFEMSKDEHSIHRKAEVSAEETSGLPRGQPGHVDNQELTAEVLKRAHPAPHDRKQHDLQVGAETSTDGKRFIDKAFGDAGLGAPSFSRSSLPHTHSKQGLPLDAGLKPRVTHENRYTPDPRNGTEMVEDVGQVPEATPSDAGVSPAPARRIGKQVDPPRRRNRNEESGDVKRMREKMHGTDGRPTSRLAGDREGVREETYVDARERRDLRCFHGKTHVDATERPPDSFKNRRPTEEMAHFEAGGQLQGLSTNTTRTSSSKGTKCTCGDTHIHTVNHAPCTSSKQPQCIDENPYIHGKERRTSHSEAKSSSQMSDRSKVKLSGKGEKHEMNIHETRVIVGPTASHMQRESCCRKAPSEKPRQHQIDSAAVSAHIRKPPNSSHSKDDEQTYVTDIPNNRVTCVSSTRTRKEEGRQNHVEDTVTASNRSQRIQQPERTQKPARRRRSSRSRKKCSDACYTDCAAASDNVVGVEVRNADRLQTVAADVFLPEFNSQAATMQASRPIGSLATDAHLSECLSRLTVTRESDDMMAAASDGPSSDSLWSQLHQERGSYVNTANDVSCLPHGCEQSLSHASSQLIAERLGNVSDCPEYQAYPLHGTQTGDLNKTYRIIQPQTFEDSKVCSLSVKGYAGGDFQPRPDMMQPWYEKDDGLPVESERPCVKPRASVPSPSSVPYGSHLSSPPQRELSSQMTRPSRTEVPCFQWESSRIVQRRRSAPPAVAETGIDSPCSPAEPPALQYAPTPVPPEPVSSPPAPEFPSSNLPYSSPPCGSETGDYWWDEGAIKTHPNELSVAPAANPLLASEVGPVQQLSAPVADLSEDSIEGSADKRIVVAESGAIGHTCTSSEITCEQGSKKQQLDDYQDEVTPSLLTDAGEKLPDVSQHGDIHSTVPSRSVTVSKASQSGSGDAYVPSSESESKYSTESPASVEASSRETAGTDVEPPSRVSLKRPLTESTAARNVEVKEEQQDATDETAERCDFDWFDNPPPEEVHEAKRFKAAKEVRENQIRFSVGNTLALLRAQGEKENNAWYKANATTKPVPSCPGDTGAVVETYTSPPPSTGVALKPHRPRRTRWSYPTFVSPDETSPQAALFQSRFAHLKTPYVDTHCHIDFLFRRSGFSGSYEDFRRKHSDTFPASYAGCVAVFCEPRTFDERGIWKSILAEPMVWGAFGCHPKNATYFNAERERALCDRLNHKSVVALGEIGLDYSGTFSQHQDVQKDVFKRQIKLALERNLPLVIHSRDAEEDTISILKTLVPKEYRIHRHCFTGSWAEAQRWLVEFPNSFLGLTPLVTLPGQREAGIRQVARIMPLERLLLETDAPYFVPNMMRGSDMTLSHPGMAVTVAAEVASQRAVDVETVLQHCRENTEIMYNIKLPQRVSDAAD